MLAGVGVMLTRRLSLSLKSGKGPMVCIIVKEYSVSTSSHVTRKKNRISSFPCGRPMGLSEVPGEDINDGV